MIMSISERTREIGIMKSLGCYVTDIRVMFLSEAGAIGLIGGLIGCVISFITSVIINLVSLGPSVENLLPAIIGGETVNRVSRHPAVASAVCHCVLRVHRPRLRVLPRQQGGTDPRPWRPSRANKCKKETCRQAGLFFALSQAIQPHSPQMHWQLSSTRLRTS